MAKRMDTVHHKAADFKLINHFSSPYKVHFEGINMNDTLDTVYKIFKVIP